jgi:hypothetical protein
MTLAIGSIVPLWAVLTYFTWAHWGDITIDCGREVYVPWVLSEGKRLYRDVWYPYGPFAPYFNALLYSLFGAKLSVLYWAGSLSALVSALLLVQLGNRVSTIAGGWAAGTILLVETLVPGTPFAFPLPYSFSAVYGCVTTCLFVTFAMEAAQSGRRRWVFAAGCVAACALTLKLEIGFANYTALAVLVLLRALRDRSPRSLALDLAACLPGAIACGLVLVWIMPPGGLEFLVQQNWMSFPGTYFMRTYGATWMALTGASMSSFQLVRAALLCVATALTWLAFWWFLARRMKGARPFLVRGVLPAVLLAVIVLLVLTARAVPGSTAEWLITEVFKLLFLPPVTFLFVLFAAGLGTWACWRSGFDRQLVGITVLFTVSGLMGLRLLHNMVPSWYSVYANGPAILSLFLLLRWLSIPYVGSDRKQVFPIGLVLSVGMFGAVAVLIGSPYQQGMRNTSLFRGPRGDLYLPTRKASRYDAAVRFMREKAEMGESVLSVPEDTGLYFFAGMECPTRVYVFSPGVLTPGGITDQTIAEIERKRVDFLIWSNRRFAEYGVSEFGVDFDRGLGDYLTEHYRPLGPLSPEGGNGWNAVVWKRIEGSGKEPTTAR